MFVESGVKCCYVSHYIKSNNYKMFDMLSFDKATMVAQHTSSSTNLPNTALYCTLNTKQLQLKQGCESCKVKYKSSENYCKTTPVPNTQLIDPQFSTHISEPVWVPFQYLHFIHLFFFLKPGRLIPH